MLVRCPQCFLNRSHALVCKCACVSNNQNRASKAGGSDGLMNALQVVDACASNISTGFQKLEVKMASRLLCKLSMHTQTFNCALEKQQRIPQHTSIFERRPLIDPSILEVMSLEEALAMLNTKEHCVSVQGFIHILQKCRKRKSLDYLKQVQKHIRDHQLEIHNVLGSYLVPTLVECGSLHEADELFGRLNYRNEYSWTALIQGYVDCGDSEHAFCLYGDMQAHGIYPNTYTYQSLVRGSIKLKSIERGRKLHFEIAEDALEGHPFVGSALVDMYAKCGLMEEAREVFNDLPSHDVVAWTALIGGYAERGQSEQALSCLVLMQEGGIIPNAMTIVCSLKGCVNLGSIHGGLWLHAKIAEESLEGDLFLGNALVDMYVKHGLFENAVKVFEMMPSRDVISWTALIMGYGERGLGEEALLSLNRMRKEGILPNDVTYVCSVKACGGSGSVDTGFEVHTQALMEGFDQHAAVGNALVDMYAKCGSLKEAWETFGKLHIRDIVAWSALIAGYAHKGESNITFQLFERMKAEGIKPDGMVLLGILNACSHAGLVWKGKDIFDTMEKDYGISPTIEHYNCILDLLGRAGQITDSMKWLEEMPLKPNFVSWSTLLSACHNWSNVEVGKHAFDYAVRLDKTQLTSYILMASIYLDAGMDEDAKRVDAMRARILT